MTAWDCPIAVTVGTVVAWLASLSVYLTTTCPPKDYLDVLLTQRQIFNDKVEVVGSVGR